MTKVNAKLADALANAMASRVGYIGAYDSIRDHVNIKTGGELPCGALDRLTDMVILRLRRKAKALASQPTF